MYIDKNIADIRREQDSKSERISQALYNTKYKPVQREEEWTRLDIDGNFEGWVRNNYLKEKIYDRGNRWRVKKLFAPARDKRTNNLHTKLAFNTKFFGEEEGDFVITKWSDGRILKIEKDRLEPAETERNFLNIGILAKEFIGTPYLWGGISPFGLDCSGFAQTLFDYLHKELPRNSKQQEKRGKEITRSSEKEVLREKPNLGDLLFFPGHVGIYLEAGRMIHSCSHENGVAITNLIDDSDYSCYLRDEMTVIKRFSDQ